MTTEAVITLADPKLRQARRGDVLPGWPTARRRFAIAFGGKTVTVPVKVAQATVTRRSASGST